MNDNAKKWVSALRSGEFEQGKGQLRRHEGLCCLGVACELAVKDGVIPDYDPDHIALPHEVQAWLGLTSNCGKYGINLFLTNDNDRGDSFTEIADTIERRQEILFG